MFLLEAIGLFILSLVILAGATSYLIHSLVFISKRIGISKFVIGTLILGIATTLPEMSSMIASNLQAVPELGIGGIIGSIVTNFCLVLGIVAILHETKAKEGLEPIIILTAISAIFLLVLFGWDGKILWYEGLFLLAIFILYQIHMYSNKVVISNKDVKFKHVKIHYVLVPLAIVAIILAALLLVETGKYLAEASGISAAVIGLIFIAFGTSVPELVTGVVSAIKKHSELSIGNLMGANITVILLAVGLAAIIKPIYIVFNTFTVPLIFAFGSTIYLILYTQYFKKVDRTLGIGMLMIYALYIYTLII